MNRIKKAYILALFIVAGFASACSKSVKSPDRTTSEVIDTALLSGNWELQLVFTSESIRTYSSADGYKLRFSSNYYFLYENGHLIRRGNYEVVNDSSASASTGLFIEPGHFEKRILFDNDTTGIKTFFDIQGNQVTFLSGFFPTDEGVKKAYNRAK